MGFKMQLLHTAYNTQSPFINTQRTLFDEILPSQNEPNLKLSKPLRSPLFYVGDKYKLMTQLTNLFPQDIQSYFEPFCGGGSSFLNVKARRYYLNDIDGKLILLHEFLQSKAHNERLFFDEIFALIKHYGLSCSLLGIIPPVALRKEFKKTYFARFNKNAYLQMRADFNADKNDIARLYLLLIYGFNRFLRFNAKGEFNLPVGNVDFNTNVFNALNGYFSFCKGKKMEFFNADYVEFLSKFEFKKDDFIYFDPPYLISDSEYNKLWSDDKEREFYAFLDELNAKGVRFGLTNLLTHKGRHNALLENFARKYHCKDIVSNYISFNDNSIKKDSKELYVSNFWR